MKKKFITLLLSACVLMTACGDSKVITTGEKPLANEVYNNETVSLAPYTGLKAEKKVYEVTDESVNNAIKERLREFADYKSVSRASREGDCVYADYTVTVDGTEAEQENNYYFTIGEKEYGAEFDEKLTGVSAGDQLDFTIDYAEDDTSSGWAGESVDFSIHVTDVQEEILPDADDTFVKENMEYDSYDAFAEDMRESVATRYEMASTEELQEELLKQVINASHILQYTKDEYDTAKADVDNAYMSYADLFGTDLDSIYEQLEMSEEDIEADVQATLSRKIIVNAIIENEKFSLSDQDYEDGIAYYMKKNDYTSREEFINDYGEEEIRRQLLEDKVLNYLIDQGDITEVTAEYTE